jgi:hypothetical protein
MIVITERNLYACKVWTVLLHRICIRCDHDLNVCSFCHGTECLCIEQRDSDSRNVTPVCTKFDFDGDRKADLSVFRQSTGQWFIILSSSGGTDNQVWGNAGQKDIPVPGDYDGDCKTDVAYWNPVDGTWNIKFNSGAAPVSTQWGSSAVGDIPVPADYDGDGKTDLAVYRQPTGQWFIILSSTGGTDNQVWGNSGQNDVPVPGDYDGMVKRTSPTGIRSMEPGISNSVQEQRLSVRHGALLRLAIFPCLRTTMEMERLT